MSWSAVETGRSPPGSDGRLSSVPVEGERGGAAGVEGGAGDGAEPDERLRELEVRHPDAVAGPAAVGDDEQITRPSASWPTPVRGLRGASWLGREGLVRAEDRAAAADEHRAAADRVRDPRPLRPEDQPQRQLGADRRLLGSRCAAVPRATSTAPSRGIAVPPAARDAGRPGRRGRCSASPAGTGR